MSRGFIGTLILEDVGDGENFYIVNPFGFEDSRGRVWWCEPGQVVNGASIPRVFWRLIGSPMTGRYRRAACLHDCAYAHQKSPREEADEMFMEAMDADGVGRVLRGVMWWAVRMFGGRNWKLETGN